MHGNQWVLKIAVLKYYSVSKRGTTAKSNPKQATDPISLHTKFGDNSSNTFPLNERKPCVTPDIGRRTPDIGHRTSDGEKSKNNISTPQGGGHNDINYIMFHAAFLSYNPKCPVMSFKMHHGKIIFIHFLKQLMQTMCTYFAIFKNTDVVGSTMQLSSNATSEKILDQK